MPPVKACRACLATDVKMYSMEDSFILNAYIKLTGIIKFETPNHICFECLSLLKKCEKFRLKCMRTHEVLANFMRQNIEITHNVVVAVDRKYNELKSLLMLSPLDTCDIYPEEYDSGTSIVNSKSIPMEIMKKEEYDMQETNQENQDFKDYKYLVDVEPLKINDDKNLVFLSCDDFHDYDESEDPGSQNGPIVKAKRRRKLKTNKSKRNAKKAKSSRRKKIKIESDCDTENLVEKNKVGKTKKKGPKSALDESFFEGFATVVLLTPEQARNEVLQRKDSSNYTNCQYKCNLCYRGYEAEVTYENHMKKHSSDNGPHKCACCFMTFPSLSMVCRHRQSCHKRKFYCQLCPYTCFSAHQAKSHVNFHKGKKYPCKECGEVFSMPNSMLMHKRIKHATECVCDLCGSTFTNERGLRSHRNMLHKQETNAREGPECEECDVHFANDIAWKRHLILSSRHGVSHGCETCGETFDDALALKVHARTHLRRRHGSATATAVCVCEVCGKTFKELCFLVLHQRTHTGERPFRCAECGKAFPSATALTSHRDTHTTSACYRCQLCTKRFTFRSSLYRHMKIAHLGFRPHKCHMCDKMFPTPCQMRAHAKYVHHKVPWPKRDRGRRQASKPAPEEPYAFDNHH